MGHFVLLSVAFVLSVLSPSLQQRPRNYRVGTIVEPPFVEKFSGPDGQQKFRGLCIDLLDKLSQMIGFNYTIYEVRDQMYGGINDQGEWNGLTGDLVAGEYDIGMAALWATEEREKYIDLTAPFASGGLTLLMKKMDVAETIDITNPSMFDFLKQGSPYLYALPAYFITCFFVWFFDLIAAKCLLGRNYTGSGTCGKTIWHILSPFTPPGSSIAMRLISGMWFLLALIIASSIVGKKELTLQVLHPPVSSIDDLARQSEIKYAPIRGTYGETYFQRKAEVEAKIYDITTSIIRSGNLSPEEASVFADVDPEEKYTNLWRYMQEAGLPTTLEEGFQRVLASPSMIEGFVLIADSTAARYAELVDCSLQVVGKEFNRHPYAIGLQQGSRLKTEFNRGLLKLRNERELEALNEKWWNQNPNKATCVELNTKEVQTFLSILLRFLGGFILLGVVLGLSIIITCIHCCCATPRSYEKGI